VLENAALNQPAFMSSMYSDPLYGGAFGPRKANDGNNDSVALKVNNSCVITLTEVDPWWAVDLGTALRVLGVYLTGRYEYWGNIYHILYYNHVR